MSEVVWERRARGLCDQLAELEVVPGEAVFSHNKDLGSHPGEVPRGGYVGD